MRTSVTSFCRRLVLLVVAGVCLPSVVLADDISGGLTIILFGIIVPASLVAGVITAGVIRAIRKRPAPWYLIPLYGLGWFAVVIIWINVSFYIDQYSRHRH